MKKVFNILKNIFVWGIVLLSIFMMIFTIVSVTTLNNNERSLFGYKAFIVQSDSMSKTDFSAGDVILAKEVDPATLKEGDIITFQSQNNENYGEIVTHKIRSLTTDSQGNPGFITYGTTTDTNDETVVTYNFILGKYTKAIPNVGRFFHFLKTVPGYITCILIPFLILIFNQLFNCIKLFRKYRNQEIEEERRQSAEMMKEIQALREQLAIKEESNDLDN